MALLHFDFSKAHSFISDKEMAAFEPYVREAANQVHQKTGQGKEFLGWVEFPEKYDRTEFQRILDAAQTIQSNSEILVVIGIGGSFLGTKAALEFCSHSFTNLLPKEKRTAPQVVFAGTNLSGTYHRELMEALEDKDFSINVISKSGTTTEPAIAFRLLKQYAEQRYGKKGAAKRIFATTDLSKGALKKLADQEGYQQFTVPDDVGGRFSVLTVVGLLPLAVAGIDIHSLMEGAARAMHTYTKPFHENAAYQYAAARNILLRKGLEVELLVSYEPKCAFLAEWWKQLFGESEGKEGKGIFPASVNFTADLHSMGQYIQEGRRFLFETILQIASPANDILVKSDPDNLDGLNYLAGKTMGHINLKAMEGTMMAHRDGGVPNLLIQLPAADAAHLGGLFYFFEMACAVSGYLLGVNPFDQPGVEAYKNNMFRLLGKH